jgi:lycopene cyclase domain-containing protein
MTGWYLGALLLSLAGLVVLDARLRLFLWRDAGRGLAVLAIGDAFFLAWDALTISRGYVSRGGGGALLGIEVAPHLPVEELVFVTFLGYLAMLAFPLAGRLLPRAGASSEARRVRTRADAGTGPGPVVRSPR